jgi:hypothetical protein
MRRQRQGERPRHRRGRSRPVRRERRRWRAHGRAGKSVPRQLRLGQISGGAPQDLVLLLEQADPTLRRPQLRVLRRGDAGLDAVLDVRRCQPVRQARRRDTESLATSLTRTPVSRFRATRTTSSRNSRGYGLGTVHILPAAPHGTTGQVKVSPDHAAVPSSGERPELGPTSQRATTARWKRSDIDASPSSSRPRPCGEPRRTKVRDARHAIAPRGSGPPQDRVVRHRRRLGHSSSSRPIPRQRTTHGGWTAMTRQGNGWRSGRSGGSRRRGPPGQ